MTHGGNASEENDGGLPDGTMEYSRNHLNTLYGRLSGEYLPSERWLFSAEVAAHHHLSRAQGKEVIDSDGAHRAGFKEDRTELTATATARWRALPWLGLGLTLREELYDDEFSPLIPALFVDGELIRGGKLVLKGSLSRNYRYPTLNDLYFQPGGNPDLKPEKGWSYDVGLDLQLGSGKPLALSGSLPGSIRASRIGSSGIPRRWATTRPRM